MELNLVNFHTRFPDEDACYEHLIQMRWPEGLACLYCGSIEIYTCKTRRLFKCADCSKIFSPIVGTIFQDTHLSLRKWFMAIYLKTTDNISDLKLASRVGVSRKTGRHLAHRIEHAMAQGDLLLTKRAQVDEMYHGPRAKGRSSARYSRKYGIMGAVEEGKEGRLVVEVVKQPDSTVVRDFFDAHIAPSAHVITDESRIYNTIRYRYQHATVNHSQRQYVVAGASTNAIENVWHHVRRMVRVHIHLSGKHLSTRLGGFQFRYNTRNLSDGAKFDQWFRQACGKTYTHRQMTAKQAVQPLALRGWARKRAAMPVQTSLFSADYGTNRA